jgi:hypothetical protein
MTFAIFTLVFFAAFATISAVVETNTVQANLLAENPNPLDHGKLLERRLFVGACWFVAMIAVSLFWWRLLWMIPAAAAIFAILHRLTFNTISATGPYYLSITNRYDLFWLGVVKLDTKDLDSYDHLYEYLNTPKYRRKVVLAGVLVYLWELLILTTFTAIATP